MMLRELDQILVDEAEKVEDLLAYHRNQVLCPVYTSVDLRSNGTKAAVVDANAFPAGFNNLSPRSHEDAADAIRNYMGRVYEGAQDILILGENHTRNKWYFQNLKALRDLFTAAGFTVTVGTMNEELFPDAKVETALGDELHLHGVLREGDALVADGLVHDVVILNNDLSSGPPAILDGLEQPVTPPPTMGWHRRSKSEHFRIVNALSEQLGAYTGLDPWLISTAYECVDVDFKAREGLDDVSGAVDRVLDVVRHKYSQYGIDREPNVFVKADAGTYGMGVMSVGSGEEFARINSKGREKMDRGKERTKISKVIVQEGVWTGTRAPGGPVAEPVLYMVCGRVVGGFLRIHESKSDTESLNAPGSRFEPFVTKPGGGPGEAALDETTAHVYQTLGEVASIATGYELRFADQPGARLPRYP